MNPVLLAIDIQKDFTKKFKLLKRRDQFDDNIAQLTSFFREMNLPIIHLLTLHNEDRNTWTLHMKNSDFRICMEGTEGAEEIEAVRRQPDEPVIYKTRWSAFYKTGLDDTLRENGYDTIFMAGFLTHACIRVTAIDAYQRDFNVIIARDCVDTYDVQHEKLTLEYLSRYAAKVMDNEEIFRLLKEFRKAP